MKNSEAILKGKRTTLELTVSEELIKFWEDRANQRKRSDMPNQPMIIGGSGRWGGRPFFTSGVTDIVSRVNVGDIIFNPANEDILGVALQPAQPGEPVSIVMQGTVKVKLNEDEN